MAEARLRRTGKQRRRGRQYHQRLAAFSGRKEDRCHPLLEGQQPAALCAGSAANSEPSTKPNGSASGGSGSGGMGRMGAGGGSGDLQQAISRMPPITLADLQKGDAVMIVATEGGANGVPTVITLLGGVEP